MAANKCWWEVFKIGLPRAMVWVGCSQFGCQEEKRQGMGNKEEVIIWDFMPTVIF